MSVASNDLTNIGFAHFDFENQLSPLLDLCHYNLLRCFNQLPDDKLEKSLHDWLLSRYCCGFLARPKDHAGNG